VVTDIDLLVDSDSTGGFSGVEPHHFSKLHSYTCLLPGRLA